MTTEVTSYRATAGKLFDSVVREWPGQVGNDKDNSRNLSTARYYFFAVVEDAEFWAEAEPFLAEQSTKKGVTLVTALKRLCSKMNKYPKGAAPAPAVPTTAPGDSLYGTATDGMTPEARAGFEQVWGTPGQAGTWPRNESYRERSDAAEAGWREAVLRRDVAVLVRTCNFYAEHFNDPIYGMVHPYHLRNFLTRDDGQLFDEWAERALYAPRPADEAAFARTWARYPAFKDKGSARHYQDSLIFYTRHIPPEHRLAFYCAASAVRDAVEQAANAATGVTEGRYVTAFIKFIGDWAAERRQPKYELAPAARDATANAVAGPFFSFLAAHDLDPARHFAAVGPGFLAANIQHTGLPAPRSVADAVAAALEAVLAASGRELPGGTAAAAAEICHAAEAAAGLRGEGGHATA